MEMKQKQEGYELLISDCYATKMIARSTNLKEKWRQPMKMQVELVTF